MMHDLDPNLAASMVPGKRRIKSFEEDKKNTYEDYE